MLKFTYRNHGRVHMLVPQFRFTTRTKFVIRGAEIYTPRNEYLGYWYGENMPHELRKQLHEHVKVWLQGKSPEEIRWLQMTQETGTE